MTSENAYYISLTKCEIDSIGARKSLLRIMRKQHVFGSRWKIYERMFFFIYIYIYVFTNKSRDIINLNFEI